MRAALGAEAMCSAQLLLTTKDLLASFRNLAQAGPLQPML